MENMEQNEFIEERVFISLCPICVNRTQSYKWFHLNCGRTVKLTMTGEIVCNFCPQRSKISHCKFQCENHESKLCTSEGIINSFCNIQNSVSDYSYLKFINDCTEIISSQFHNIPKSAFHRT